MSDLITYVTDLNTRLEKLNNLENLVISSEDEVEKYAGWVAYIRGELKKTETEKKRQLTPIEKQKQVITDYFKPSIIKMSQAARTINTKILDYRADKEEKLLAQQKINPEAIIEAPVKTIRTSQGTMSIKKVWKHKIIDITEVPKEYWVVDETKIHQAVMNGEREIKGVKIYQDSIIATRTK